MNEIVIRGKIYNPKHPVICVPVMEMTKDAFVKKVTEYATGAVGAGIPAEAIEIRADYLGAKALEDTQAMCDMMRSLRAAAGETVLLFTVRTKAEGGTVEVSSDVLNKLYLALLETGSIDLYDVELDQREDCEEIAEAIRRSGAVAVFSHHNFIKTYEKDEIISCLERMRDKGADVCKIALMPESEEDVDTVITAAYSFAVANPDKGVIAISMGELGRKTRTECEKTGSMLTFAAYEDASAPGQVGYREMLEIYKRK